MDQFRSLLGQEKEKEEPTLTEEIKGGFDKCCKLSYKQRLIGFACCFGAGVLISLLSTFMVPTIITNPTKFAVLYTLGNVLALASTGFLIGPWRQIKNMASPHRWIASLIFIGAMALTIYAAVKGNTMLVLIAMVIQFCALLWYCLSYIPFARAAVKKTMSSCV